METKRTFENRGSNALHIRCWSNLLQGGCRVPMRSSHAHETVPCTLSGTVCQRQSPSHRFLVDPPSKSLGLPMRYTQSTEGSATSTASQDSWT